MTLQERIIKIKKKNGFNITNVEKEFCLCYGEMAEAYDAYRKNDGSLGEELADVTIYLLGIAEILGIDLEAEVLRKININENRDFKKGKERMKTEPKNIRDYGGN